MTGCDRATAARHYPAGERPANDQTSGGAVDQSENPHWTDQMCRQFELDQTYTEDCASLHSETGLIAALMLLATAAVIGGFLLLLL